MRAAVLSATIIALGLYLAIAAVFTLGAGWIAAGMMSIAAIGAVLMVRAAAPASSGHTVRA